MRRSRTDNVYAMLRCVSVCAHVCMCVCVLCTFARDSLAVDMYIYIYRCLDVTCVSFMRACILPCTTRVPRTEADLLPAPPLQDLRTPLESVLLCVYASCIRIEVVMITYVELISSGRVVLQFICLAHM